MHHAQNADGSLDTLQRHTMDLLQPTGALYANWLRLHDPDQPWRLIMQMGDCPTDFSPHASQPMLLMENGKDPDETGSGWVLAILT